MTCLQSADTGLCSVNITTCLGSKVTSARGLTYVWLHTSLGSITCPTLPTALKVWLAVKLQLVQDSMVGNEAVAVDMQWTKLLTALQHRLLGMSLL